MLDQISMAFLVVHSQADSRRIRAVLLLRERFSISITKEHFLRWLAKNEPACRKTS